MLSLFRKFKKGLERTGQAVADKVGGVFGRAHISPEDIEELEEALYGADFGPETTAEIIDEVQAALRADKELRGADAAAAGAVNASRMSVADMQVDDIEALVNEVHFQPA